MHIDHRLTEDLTSKKRYTEAGHVLLDYAEDVREAVIALVQGNQFSEARRIVSHRRAIGYPFTVSRDVNFPDSSACASRAPRGDHRPCSP